MNQKKKKSTVSWILEFAGTKKWFYIFSVLASIVGVGFSILPYLVIKGKYEVDEMKEIKAVVRLSLLVSKNPRLPHKECQSRIDSWNK